jgi:uncharacterized protein YutD
MGFNLPYDMMVTDWQRGQLDLKGISCMWFVTNEGKERFCTQELSKLL